MGCRFIRCIVEGVDRTEGLDVTVSKYEIALGVV